MAKLHEPRLAAQRKNLPEQSESAARCRLRNSLIVRKSGRCIPVTAAKSSRSSQPRAILRDE